MEQPLVTAASFAVPQLINERVAPAALKLRQISIDENGALRVLAPDAGYRIPARLGRYARQRLQPSGRVTLEMVAPSGAVIAEKPVPRAIEHWIGRVPGLIVEVKASRTADIIVGVGVIGKSRALRQ